MERELKQIMRYYYEDKERVLQSLDSCGQGLSDAEAAARLERNGRNKLKEAKKESLLSRFFNQLKDPMIIILIAAAIVSGVVSVVEKESFSDTIIIIAVVLLNAVLGVYQESKAEKAIEALQAMSSATSRVLRGGMVRLVKSEELVVGDVVLLEAGDAVPADARVIECASLQAEEAALTGESVPVNKQVETIEDLTGKECPLGDRVNMVYMGSTIVYGRGYAVITATGMDTEMGKIADALTKAESGQTPLQIKLGQLSRILTYCHRHMHLYVRLQPFDGKKRHHARTCSEHIHGCGQPCGCRNSGRACNRCYNFAFDRRYENEQAQCRHKEAYSR